MKARAKNKKTMLDFFDYSEEYLNEREKIEGIDPLKILEMAEEELGRWEEEEKNGFELNVRNKDYTYYLRTTGTELNADLPA